MKASRKILLPLVLLVSLSAGAALLWQLQPRLTSAGVARTIQLPQATEIHQLIMRTITFGMGDIWIRIKCLLESLAASNTLRCNHGPVPISGSRPV